MLQTWSMVGWLLGWFTERQFRRLSLVHQRDDAARSATREIFDGFVRGANLAFRRAPLARLREVSATEIPWHRRPFFWEGVAFGRAGRHSVRPGRWRPEPAGDGAYRAMHYTGYGMWSGVAGGLALPSVPVTADHWRAVSDHSRLSPLIAGGTAFALVAHTGRFDSARLHNAVPRGQPDIWRTATWHGSGRALWFLYMNNVEPLVALLDAHPQIRTELLEGLGMAITFTNIASPEAGRGWIRQFPGTDQPALWRGCGICLNALVEDDPDNAARVAAIDIEEFRAARDAGARASSVVPRGPEWYQNALAYLRQALPDAR